jgi:uncharacterized protein YjbI with pentapeptide repeats
MKNKINSRSVRMIAVNSRETTLTNSLATITNTVPTDKKEDYSGIDFSNVTDFSTYVFKGANLKRAVFDNLDFENELNNNNGKKLILPPNKSKLDFLDFSGADLTGASFYETTMPNANFQGANCTRASFIYTKMHNAKFQGATISKSNFGGADLTGADFSGLKMTDVSFEEANLTKANFSNTKIIIDSSTEFIQANFTDANFSGANFIGYADFTGGIFKNTNFKNAIINGSFKAAVDRNRDPEGKSSFFENVDFTNANLEKIYFNADKDKQITLNNVNFTGTKFPNNRDIFIVYDYSFLNGVGTYYKYMSVIFISTPCPQSVKCKV